VGAHARGSKKEFVLVHEFTLFLTHDALRAQN
jgi:hypothetical protein